MVIDMKPIAVIGILLIVLGILAFGYQGVLWVTSSEQVAKVGPVEINQQKSTPIPLAPIIGGATIVGGLLCLGAGARGRT
jgi:hypothetical protein